MLLKRHSSERNKGFTLVELIIILAIISVLVAVMAPRYLLQVEKSRIGIDEAYIGEVAHVLEVIAVTDVRMHSAPVTVTFDATGKIQGSTASGAAASVVAAAVDAELSSVFPLEEQKFQSNYYKGIGAEASSGVILSLSGDGVVTISGTKNIDTTT